MIQDVGTNQAEVIRLKEFDSDDVAVEDLLVDGIFDTSDHTSDRDLFQLRVAGGRLQIAARGFVGVIPINDRLTLEVVPRFPGTNVARMMEISRELPKELAGATRGYVEGGELYPSLVGVYSRALATEIEMIAALGMLKEYQWREETTSFPRGRVLAGQTLQKRIARGVDHQLVIGWHQRTIDSAPNRCLKAAVHSLHRFAGRMRESIPTHEQREVARLLNQCDHLLAGVTLDPYNRFLQDGVVAGSSPLPQLRSYYGSALALARLIIAGRAIVLATNGDQVHLQSLLVDMGAVFEAYLREVLVAAAQDGDWPLAVLDGNLGSPVGGKKANLFDVGPAVVVATPDVVLTDDRGPQRQHPIVIDMKYKPAQQSIERDSLNQVLTYGLAYRAKHVIVAQPRRQESGIVPGLWPHGEVAGIRVWRYVFDLASTDIEAQERLWADAVRSLI